MIYYVIKKDEKVFVQGAKGFTPKNNIGIVPNSIAKEDYPFIQAIVAIDQFGETYWNITIDQAAKAAGQVEKLKEKNLQDSKAKKAKAISDKGEEVFPGLSAGELVLKAEMWRHMDTNAAAFMSAGLKVVEQVDAADGSELFSPGSALDNPAKIKSYAGRKLELYEAFLTEMALAEQIHEDEKGAILGA
jgi:hypothetical protein